MAAPFGLSWDDAFSTAVMHEDNVDPGAWCSCPVCVYVDRVVHGEQLSLLDLLWQTEDP